MPRYSIITPTIVRSTLPILCDSIDRQTDHDWEHLTTKIKQVDVTKAIADLGHRNTVTLEEGMRITADWMRGVYDK